MLLLPTHFASALFQLNRTKAYNYIKLNKLRMFQSILSDNLILEFHLVFQYNNLGKTQVYS